MKTYRFTIYLNGVEMTDDVAEALYEAGCDDCTPCSHGDESYAHFSREANSLESAVASAVANVKSAGYEVERVQINESDLAGLTSTG